MEEADAEIFNMDDMIVFFRNARDYARANGHGNAEGVLMRIERDLEALRSLPQEAWRPPVEPEPTIDSSPEPEVNREFEAPSVDSR